ncbi:hypothetical protein C6P44_003511 [Monosporozyma unispora]|nr:hypothetical protein C6P44_003511 [Kazachstania unispora]
MYVLLYSVPLIPGADSPLNSVPYLSSTSSNSSKFVRFAPQLTTVKNFHINDKPISISNETSPILYPLSTDTTEVHTTLYDIDDDDLDDDLLWLNQKINNYNLTYTDITPTNNNNIFNNFNSSISSTNFNLSSNLSNQNVKLIKLYQRDNIIYGTIKCNNLAFEKFIQCKFTFNNWENIHYITATYSNSPCEHNDVFKFKIDLNLWKFFLQYNKLIVDGIVDMQFVIMYDVLGTTYYDNNNNKNFTLNLQLSPIELSYTPPAIKHNNINNININNNNNITTRKFSDDTDYYNESPLKHMFHTDTTWIHPKNQNKLTFFNKTGDLLVNDEVTTPSLSSSYSDLSSDSWDDDISSSQPLIYNNFIINNNSNDTLLFFDGLDESDNDTITPQNNNTTTENDTSTILTDETVKKPYTYLINTTITNSL